MPLRNQPYLPLYVKDFMTDEKLIECSAATTGIYIRIMCILHKQETYGKLLLKQKYKQTSEQILNFAVQLATSLPYSSELIYAGLKELIEEKVLFIEDGFLLQKRMVKDNETSTKRAKAGSIGGKKTTKIFAQAKIQANTVNANEDVNENESLIHKMKVCFLEKNKEYPQKDEIDLPALRQIAEYFLEGAPLDENSDHEKILELWKWAVIKMPAFYKIKGLKSIANNFQSIILEIKNGKNGHKKPIITSQSTKEYLEKYGLI